MLPKPKKCKLLVAFLAIGMVSCIQKNDMWQPPEGLKYKKSVYFTYYNPNLTPIINSKLKRYKSITAASQPQYADVVVNIQPQVQENTILNGQPNLFGTLSPQRHTLAIVTDYTLKTSSGDVLYQGKIHTTGGQRMVIYPNAARPQLSKTALENLSNELLKRLNSQLAQVPWQTTVVSQMPSGHVLLSANSGSGLRPRHLLTTQTEPKALVEVVTFDQEGQVIARAIEGVIPPNGTALIPIAK